LTPIIAGLSAAADTSLMRLACLIVVGSATLFFATTAVGAPSPDAAGKRLAQKCKPCHAVGAKDSAKGKAAPPFRTLARKYPLDSLQEALAEGIFTGHTDRMPQIKMNPKEIEAFLAYLQSIQK
jgi:cytochrome c